MFVLMFAGMCLPQVTALPPPHDLPATRPARARARNRGSQGRPSSAGPCQLLTPVPGNESSGLSFLSMSVISWKQPSQKPAPYRPEACTEGFAVTRSLADTTPSEPHQAAQARAVRAGAPELQLPPTCARGRAPTFGSPRRGSPETVRG